LERYEAIFSSLRSFATRPNWRNSPVCGPIEPSGGHASRQAGGSQEAATVGVDPRFRSPGAERAALTPEASLPDRIVFPHDLADTVGRRQKAPAGLPDPPVHGCDGGRQTSPPIPRP
jgi:hypothetical protein